MISPKNIEELANLVEQDGKKVFLFVADWCGDCRYIYPALPEIEEANPEFTFIRVDRDEYMELAKLWDVYGIPSLVVLDKDKEIGRFVNSDRKTKGQINDFLASLKWEKRMIFTYNKEHVGDVLMVIVKNSGDAKLDVERKGNVARVFLKENGETVAWNIFEVSSMFEIAERGQVFLTDDQVARLNQELQEEGFAEEIINDKEPKFVVAEIVEMVAHPDSDHLNICQVAVGNDKTVQIVAGAPNARVGLKTIVALPGAMMPKGNLIFPGELRGEKSFGMMCSPRELALPNAPQKRGVIELSDDQVVGTPFDPATHWTA